MLPLFILFVVLPIAEIMLLINVSATIGGWNTFFVVIVTAFFGAYFVRQQGFALIQQIQNKLAAGKAPSTEMTEGLLLLVAGVLLITPGFITDVLGFLFTLPFSRGPIARFAMSKVNLQKVSSVQFGQDQNFNQTPPPNSPFDQGSPKEDGDVFEGEYQDKTQNDEKNRLN